MSSSRSRNLAFALTVLLLVTLGLSLAMLAFIVPAAQAQGTATVTATATNGIRTVTGTPLATGSPVATTASPVATTAGTATPAATASPAATSSPMPTSVATSEPITPPMPIDAYTNITGTVPATTERTITVVGEGRVFTQPDIAYANIGVEVVTDTVRAASTQARDTMAAVLEALEAEGIAERDIQTSGYNIFMERVSPPLPDGRPGPEQIRYHVSNQVQVTIRSLDRVGTVLDAAINAGANNIFGVTFALDSMRQAEMEAYDSAMADALVRADYLAGLAGLDVGPVVSISEVLGQQVIFQRDTRAALGMGGGGAGPISPGELQITRQVEVVFVLR